MRGHVARNGVAEISIVETSLVESSLRTKRRLGILLRACVHGTYPPINLAVKGNREPVADRELSLRASHEVAEKTTRCSPRFLLLVHESDFGYVTVIVKLP